MRQLAVASALLLFACSTSETPSSPSADSTPKACSPLETADAPIALEQVVGAGRHADGTIYVLDRGGRSDYRAFISEGGTLQRKKVAGSGSEGDAFVVASIADASSPFSIKIESSNGAVTRMGVFRGALETKDFTLGEQGELLEVIAAADYAALPVRNLPGKVVVEYDAATTDGHRIVVTRPETDWSYEDFRIFYGTADAMIERPVTNASRGSSTYLTFTIDGVPYDAYFPSSLSSPAQGEASLSSNGAKQPLTVRGVESSPGIGLTYFCL